MELQVTALPAAHSWGRSAFLTVASTVATRFQQVPIFDKKEKKFKRSLNFYWLPFLADHHVCRPQQVARPSNSLPYVYYPSAVYLRSISYDLLSWIVFFFLSFLICFKSVIPYHIDVILSRCIL